MRPNAVESHPQRTAIEAELIAGASVRAIAAKYGIPKSAVQRHRDKFPVFVKAAIAEEKDKRAAEEESAPEPMRDTVPEPMRDTPPKEEEKALSVVYSGTDVGTEGEKPAAASHAAAVQSGQTILEQARSLNASVLEIFNKCKEERPAIALQAVREATRLMELQGKLLGDLKSETDVKIAIVLPEGMRNANIDR